MAVGGCGKSMVSPYGVEEIISSRRILSSSVSIIQLTFIDTIPTSLHAFHTCFTYFIAHVHCSKMSSLCSAFFYVITMHVACYDKSHFHRFIVDFFSGVCAKYH
jgi:hypothetical protein